MPAPILRPRVLICDQRKGTEHNNNRINNTAFFIKILSGWQIFGGTALT
jgi:hypothetical protein